MDDRIYQMAQAEHLLGGGGRASLRRAESLYRCDERLFVQCLDALCCGKVGAHETFAAFCADGRAVAAALESETAARLLSRVEPARAVLYGHADADAAASSGDLSLRTCLRLAEWDAFAAKRMAHLAGLGTAPFEGLAALMASDDAMRAVAANREAVSLLAASRAACAELLAVPRALAAMAESLEAAAAMVASETFAELVAAGAGLVMTKSQEFSGTGTKVLSGKGVVVLGVEKVRASTSLAAPTAYGSAKEPGGTSDVVLAAVPAAADRMAPVMRRLYRHGSGSLGGNTGWRLSTVGAGSNSTYTARVHYVEIDED